MTEGGVLFLGVVVVLLAGLLYWILGQTGSKRSHTYRIERSVTVLQKIAQIHQQGPAQVFGYLRKVDCFVFEELLLTALEERGFQVARNNRYTGDGGFDGQFYDADKALYLIQAKRYSGYIARKHVDEFARLLAERPDVRGGLFIHTGKTPRELIRESRLGGITIISGEKLLNLLLHNDPIMVYAKE